MNQTGQGAGNGAACKAVALNRRLRSVPTGRILSSHQLLCGCTGNHPTLLRHYKFNFILCHQTAHLSSGGG